MLKTEIAEKFFKAGEYETAESCYLELKESLNTNIFDYNIDLCRQLGYSDLENYRCIENETPDLARVFKALNIQKIYIVNLNRRADRKIKTLREFSKYNIDVFFIEAEDALTSSAVHQAHDQYVRRQPGTSKYNSHIDPDTQKRMKQYVTKGAFAYNYSQLKVFKHAIRNDFNRIAVFDDDIFFTDNAPDKIASFLKFTDNDFKICLLGASEYSSSEYRNEFINSNDFYKPNPGFTCGSFGIIYDRSVFSELVNVISEQDGTYDNSILGHFYHSYPDKCFVINPNVCIPSIEDSNIREEDRKQISHSKLMGWNLDNYSGWRKPISANVIISNIDCLRYVSSLSNEFLDLSVNIYYISCDGLRLVIPGHNRKDNAFLSTDIDCAFYGRPRNDQKQALTELGLPFSDYTFIWDTSIPLCLENIRVDLIKYLQSQETTNTIFEKIGFKGVSSLASIIIPSFRSAYEVLPTVKSALGQSYSKYEVIVVSDNPNEHTFSTDLRKLLQSEGLLKESLDRLKIVSHSVNRMASAARNTGLHLSKGEYIFFLDDDDIYKEHRLANSISKLEVKPDFDAIYCGYEGSWNGHKDCTRFREGNFFEEVIKLKYATHYMCTNTVTYRRSALNYIGGFNESYRRHQDLEVNARFFAKGFKIMFVDTFDAVNRPAPVKETFKADIFSLLSLKMSFIKDFSHLIKKESNDYIDEVIEAHSEDIFKRGVKDQLAKEVIKVSLQNALLQS